LAEIKPGLQADRNEQVHFKGNILSLDGRNKVEIEKMTDTKKATGLGKQAAEELLANGGEEIAENIRHATE